MTITLILTLVVIQQISYTSAGCETFWEDCGCRWEEWEAWGDCDSECNGQRGRTRRIRLSTNITGCDFGCNNFAILCDVDSWDYSQCNTFCQNGGSSDGNSCSCVTGFNGTCCENEITCGDPGAILNGQIHGTSYVFDKSISYTCNDGYLLIDGSSVRTCQLSELWDGIKPRCAYIISCSSNPCKNGAVCENIPDDYRCTCTSGWSGKGCDLDIQPPLMTNCSNDIMYYTSSLTERVAWKKPFFHDPHNFGVKITPNYLTNEFEFPWGDFNVSYFAIKPSNGLSKECLFQIKLRPNPCSPINIPVNGALVCNDWKIDYGQFCIIFCLNGYSVSRGIETDDFYVCGASGTWTPGKVPDCNVIVKDDVLSPTVYTSVSTFTNCTSDRHSMQEVFLTKMKQSTFAYFCEKFPDECIIENVLVDCY